MRFYGIALAASVLGACAGGERPAGDTTAVAIDTSAGSATTPALPVSGTVLGPATPAPITGTTHEVKMLGDAQGYRFEPANITVKAGDGIRFVMVSGGPHNVAFDPAKIPDDVEPQLDANISEKMGPLASALKMNPGETITLSLGNVKPGTYPFYCTPHLALGMTGNLTVQ